MTEYSNTSNLKNCDIVMKGGITSGVVYPLAIVELSKKYRFRSIGGASAGAIAAAATAAAEYGRLRGGEQAGGFKQLAELPDELGSSDFLVKLFSPADSTAKGFRVAIRVLKAKSWRRVVAGLWALLTNFVSGTVFGLFASLLVIAFIVWLGNFTSVTSRQAAVLLFLGVVWTILATLVTVFVLALLQTARGLVSNGFGFCNGFSETPGAPHLTNWMYDLYNKLAGLPQSQPLTFGHLWTADGSDGREKAINLQVITTNLTQLSPYTIPFRDTAEVNPQQTFYFNPREWALLFPKDVMKWISDNPATVKTPVVSSDGERLVPLPSNANLPVVVAARLSLSFPGLVSAVPLYAIDCSLKRNQNEPETFLGERCWFSDGGITSNFPVHFFDSPLPRWPTFGINLKEAHPEHKGPFYLPRSCQGGQLASWQRFNPTNKALMDLREFVGAILNTMLAWRDNLQTRMPGYRNRIAHINLNHGEGGLNLTMPRDLVLQLISRGRDAGIALRDQFDFPQHVWTRYRTTMSILDAHLGAFAKRYENAPPEAVEVWDIIKGKSEAVPKCNPWSSAAQHEFAVEATKEIARTGSEWSEKGHPFEQGAPTPEPQLRAQPQY